MKSFLDHEAWHLILSFFIIFVIVHPFILFYFLLFRFSLYERFCCFPNDITRYVVVYMYDDVMENSVFILSLCVCIMLSTSLFFTLYKSVAQCYTYTPNSNSVSTFLCWCKIMSFKLCLTSFILYEMNIEIYRN